MHARWLTCRPGTGCALLAKHLELRKALIVIDDAYDVQLNLLLPQREDGCKFHPESIVIVTSRDRRALERHETFVYKMELLQKELAVRLFAGHAFPAERQPVVLNGLMQKMVECCNGLPLALKVCNPDSSARA